MYSNLNFSARPGYKKIKKNHNFDLNILKETLARNNQKKRLQHTGGGMINAKTKTIEKQNKFVFCTKNYERGQIKTKSFWR